MKPKPGDGEGVGGKRSDNEVRSNGTSSPQSHLTNHTNTKTQHIKG